MSNAVADFLARLGEHPRLRVAFACDAEATMCEARLTEADRAILRLGEERAIRRAAGVGDELAPKIISFPSALA